jgi:succinate-semialdehyde dehydrogenase / glutarate-semialdehyde dehydrogenase
MPPCGEGRRSWRSRPSTRQQRDDVDKLVADAVARGADAWTNDETERSRLIRDLTAGMVFINGNVTSYPQLPFGGVRSSGRGRELSVQGIREFCNIKTVWIGHPGTEGSQ